MMTTWSNCESQRFKNLPSLIIALELVGLGGEDATRLVSKCLSGVERMTATDLATDLYRPCSLLKMRIFLSYFSIS